MKLDSRFFLLIAFVTCIIATVIIVAGADHPNSLEGLKAMEALDFALGGALAGAHIQR